MKTIKIKSIQDIIKASKQAVEYFRSKEIWWRGERKSCWHLEAGIYRRTEKETFPNLEALKEIFLINLDGKLIQGIKIVLNSTIFMNGYF